MSFCGEGEVICVRLFAVIYKSCSRVRSMTTTMIYMTKVSNEVSTRLKKTCEKRRVKGRGGTATRFRQRMDRRDTPKPNMTT